MNVLVGGNSKVQRGVTRVEKHKYGNTYGTGTHTRPGSLNEDWLSLPFPLFYTKEIDPIFLEIGGRTIVCER